MINFRAYYRYSNITTNIKWENLFINKLLLLALIFLYKIYQQEYCLEKNLQKMQHKLHRKNITKQKVNN